MSETTPELPITGQSIENLISYMNPEVNLDDLLADDFGIHQKDASFLANGVRAARVFMPKTDAMTMAFGYTTEIGASPKQSIDSYLPQIDTIVVRSGLVEVFRRSMDTPNMGRRTHSLSSEQIAQEKTVSMAAASGHYDDSSGRGILNLSPEQIEQTAVHLATVYELGEFVSRKVYDLLSARSPTVNVDERLLAHSNSEAQGFYDQVLDDVKARDPEGVIEDHTPSEDALEHYYKNTRRLRFCAAGGWMLVSRVDDRINITKLQKAIRSYHYDDMARAAVLPPEDIGSLYPLNIDEFTMLCSFIRGTDKATPIDKFKT